MAKLPSKHEAEAHAGPSKHRDAADAHTGSIAGSGGPGGISIQRKGLMGALVLVAVAIMANGAADVTSSKLPGPGKTMEIEVSGGDLVELPNSQIGQISVLEDALGTPQARSYDGNNWELMKGSSIDCSGDNDKCTVGLSESNDGDNKRTLLLRQFKPTKPGENRSNARFLLQASFGPTLDSIGKLGELGKGARRFKTWVEDQIALPATLHRAFYRKRVNQPVEYRSAVGRPHTACEAGSRWHRHAFTLADVGKEMVHSSEAGYYQLKVDGVIRHQESDLGSWRNSEGNSFKICSVIPSVGGDITFGRSGKCGVSMENPAITFAKPDADRVLNAVSLVDLEPPVPGSKLMNEAAECALPAAGGHVFAEGSKGEYYMHTPRLVLMANTVEEPHVGSTAGANCPSTPRTFVNEASCVPVSCTNEEDQENKFPTTVLSCGSPGEVANEPALGSRWGMGITSDSQIEPLGDRFDEVTPGDQIQAAVWINIALEASDQLRQRVAWVFSQVLVITQAPVGGRALNELFFVFYDILVRHAFGNFKDMLKEVSYSPAMGKMLSFEGSRSFENSGNYPDENYAREVMQLFSLGQFKLNPDGTTVLDADGVAVPTYDNEDIMALARAWTGFHYQEGRSNVEGKHSHDKVAKGNQVDPMEITGSHRDVFPKLGAGGTYYGDGVALCEELPEKAFLRKGAKWRFLGASPNPDLQEDVTGGLLGEESMRMELNTKTSALFTALCNAKDAHSTNLADCRWSADMVLQDNLACDGAECLVDTVKVVMLPGSARRCPEHARMNTRNDDTVCTNAWTRKFDSCPSGCWRDGDEKDGDKGKCRMDGSETDLCRVDAADRTAIYFEYVQPACVHLPFFNGGLRIGSHNHRDASCADPRSMAASEGCCDRNGNGYEHCQWAGGELMSFSRVQSRCATMGVTSDCEMKKMNQFCQPPGSQRPGRIWSNSPCGVQVKVHRNGQVAIVHDVKEHSDSNTKTEHQKKMRSLVKSSTENWFRALTLAGSAPTDSDSCRAASGCTVIAATDDGNDASCLCDTFVVETKVFSEMPTVAEAVAQLHIGSPAVDSFNKDDYKPAGRGENGAMQVWRKASVNKRFTADTVFEVTASVHGPARLLRNVKSTVTVGETGWSFRNPPTFHTFSVDPTRRDAEYETDAVLEHLLWHPNTGPFIGMTLIRHLVTSNPSPGYVQVVATAFREGVYAGIGSGVSGDLAATVAAVLLEDEARSPLLDFDPSFGKTGEPMTKLIHFCRSMGLKPQRALIVMDRLGQSTGMELYSPGTVFSFYQQDFSPVGRVKTAGLLAPEAQLLTPPILVQFLNSLFSTIKHGLSHCEGGLGIKGGDEFRLSCDYVTGKKRDPDQHFSRGWLTFEPSHGDKATPKEVVDELDLLLTAGRLDDHARAIIEKEMKIEAATDGGTPASAMRLAQHLLLSSPQFHTSNQCTALPSDAITATVTQPKNAGRFAKKPYKAIIYIKLRGGMDSYNLLVPHSKCKDKDMYAEYKEVRKNVALEKDKLLQIDASGSGQVCDTFGLHPEMGVLQDLYEDKDALFLANTGVLIEPVTRDGDQKRSPGGFAHNGQQRSLDSLYPQGIPRTGVLGRVMDELKLDGYNTTSASIYGNTLSLVGDPSVNPVPDIVSEHGEPHVLDGANPLSDRTVSAIQELNVPQSSIFGNTWASSVQNDHVRSKMIRKAIQSVELVNDFPGSRLGRQAEQVATLIKARGHFEANRQAFYMSMTGFDTHRSLKSGTQEGLNQVATALDPLIKELKDEGVWDNVAIITISEFSRTLTTNGRGTDHGWGGNYFLLGGSVNGGRILGKYPDNLKDNSPLNVGRGRLIPTTSWEHVWNGLALWFGVEDEKLGNIMPNMDNFPKLFTQEDLFVDGGAAGDEVATVPTEMPTNVPAEDAPKCQLVETAGTKAGCELSCGKYGGDNRNWVKRAQTLEECEFQCARRRLCKLWSFDGDDVCYHHKSDEPESVELEETAGAWISGAQCMAIMP